MGVSDSGSLTTMQSGVDWGCSHLKALQEKEDLFPKRLSDIANKLVLARGGRP